MMNTLRSREKFQHCISIVPHSVSLSLTVITYASSHTFFLLCSHTGITKLWKLLRKQVQLSRLTNLLAFTSAPMLGVQSHPVDWTGPFGGLVLAVCLTPVIKNLTLIHHLHQCKAALPESWVLKTISQHEPYTQVPDPLSILTTGFMYNL